MKWVFNFKKMLLFFFSLYIYCNSYICFSWKTYLGGALYLPVRLTTLYAGFAFMLGYVMFQKKIHFNWISVLTVLLCLFYIFQISALAVYKSWHNANLLLLVSVFFLSSLKKEELVDIFQYLTIIFIVLSLPSIVYFLLTSAGVSLPYRVLFSSHELKAANSVFYEHYPLGLIIHSANRRPCGMFDEPGYMGTLAALFFCAYLAKGKFDKKAWVILFIAVFSTSLAAYLILAIGFIVSSIKKGAFEVTLCVLVLLTAYFAFVNLKFESPMITSIQHRMLFANGEWNGDNRTGELFEAAYRDFVKKGGYPFWFGKGYSAKSIDMPSDGSAVYTQLIYEYGIIGFSLSMLLLFLLALNRSHNALRIVVFILPFFASVYQRPYVMNVYFLTLLCSSTAFIVNEEPSQRRLLDKTLGAPGALFLGNGIY